MTRANLVGGIGAGVGACVGGAAALTAVLPTTALWTSRFVCGRPGELMISTAGYSYKPGQSGTSIGFQCVTDGGSRDAGFWAITALQTLLVALLLGGTLVIVLVARRLAAKQTRNVGREVVAGGAGLVAVIAGTVLLVHALTSAGGPVNMPHGGSLTVHGNGENQSIACNDGSLTINGRDEMVTVTGHCIHLSVDGVIHHISVDSADMIDVNGLDNVITYRFGSPRVTNSGFRNVVQKA